LNEVRISEDRKGKTISQIGDYKLGDCVLWMAAQSFFIVEMN